MRELVGVSSNSGEDHTRRVDLRRGEANRILVDRQAHFSRRGPRLVDMAAFLQPEEFPVVAGRAPGGTLASFRA